MKRKTMLRAGIGAAAIAVVALTAGIALASRSDDETPLTGDTLTRASAAALAHTGGGTVTETEASDEKGAYEVEVTRADGTKVEVYLDANFVVIGTETDGEGDESGDRD